MEIKLQNVEFSYSRNSEKVLNGINLKIESARVTGIIGSSASGKTTLLELLAGRIIPTKGKILFGNLIISKRRTTELLKIKSNVGYVPQYLEESYLFDTVSKDLYSYLEMFDIDDIDKRVSDTFKQLDLDINLLDRDPFSLSSGELRLISLARILIQNPEIIVLDEPIVGLDSVNKQNLINLLTKIKKIYSKTIIVASNDIDFIDLVSDNIVVLKDHKVIKSGNNSEIFNDVNFLHDNEIVVPQISLFKELVWKEKGIRLMYRSEINDLVKDILRKV